MSGGAEGAVLAGKKREPRSRWAQIVDPRLMVCWCRYFAGRLFPELHHRCGLQCDIDSVTAHAAAGWKWERCENLRDLLYDTGTCFFFLSRAGSVTAVQRARL